MADHDLLEGPIGLGKQPKPRLLSCIDPEKFSNSCQKLFDSFVKTRIEKETHIIHLIFIAMNFIRFTISRTIGSSDEHFLSLEKYAKRSDTARNTYLLKNFNKTEQ